MIQAVLFDLGDTLWHFPQMPPIEVIRGETVHRISDLLRSWGVEPDGELFFLGRDIRVAVEKETDAAYWGDLASPFSAATRRRRISGIRGTWAASFWGDGCTRASGRRLNGCGTGAIASAL